MAEQPFEPDSQARRGPGRPLKYTSADERREARNAADRERRARKRAEAIANGTYRQPDRADQKALPTPDNVTLDDRITASRDKRLLYLAYLEKGLRRSQAAEKAGVAYSTVKYWRKTDDAFRLKEADVEETFLDNVEDVVRQLAQANDLKAALTILERRRPEVWAPKQRVEVEHKLQFAGSIEERMDRIARLMEAAKRPELEPVIWDAEVVEDSASPELLPSPSEGLHTEAP